MTDKEINTNKYFVELTDIGGGTIGYTVPFPEELLREIVKQNKQLKRKEQECEELKKALEEIEKVCLEDTYTFADGTQVRYDTLDDILNIIKRVKENNEGRK